MDERFRVAGPREVDEALDGIAAAVHARLGSDVVIVGLRRRGVPIAAALAERMAERGGRPVRRAELTVKRYSDDLAVLHERPELTGAEELDLEGETAVLVDDVLYTGRSLLASAEAAVAAGAARVHAAVLCSRGGNELPVAADWIGFQLDVGPDAVVEVGAPPYEERFEVELRRLEGPAAEGDG